LAYAQDARQIQDCGGGGKDDDDNKDDARESSLSTGIIQLALNEFPACALLWIYYLDCVRDLNVWTEATGALRGLQTAAGGGGTTIMADVRSDISPLQI